jgi:hypothetical protein
MFTRNLCLAGKWNYSSSSNTPFLWEAIIDAVVQKPRLTVPAGRLPFLEGEAGIGFSQFILRLPFLNEVKERG